MTPSEAPKALQASECSELLDPTRANCWISAQHQPGKFTNTCSAVVEMVSKRKQKVYSACRVLPTSKSLFMSHQTSRLNKSRSQIASAQCNWAGPSLFAHFDCNLYFLSLHSHPAVGATSPRKNSEIHIDVSHSRQPLVKGERLVRYEVNTVMLHD